MKTRLVILSIMLLLACASPAWAQEPPPSLIPGCSHWPAYQYVNALGEWTQAYGLWCGSDEEGWFKPDEWCAYSGYCWWDYYPSSGVGSWHE